MAIVNVQAPPENIVSIVGLEDFTSSTSYTLVKELTMPASGILSLSAFAWYINSEPVGVLISMANNTAIYNVIAASIPGVSVGANLAGRSVTEGEKLYIFAKYKSAGNNRISWYGTIILL